MYSNSSAKLKFNNQVQEEIFLILEFQADYYIFSLFDFEI